MLLSRMFLLSFFGATLGATVGLGAFGGESLERGRFLLGE